MDWVNVWVKWGWGGVYWLTLWVWERAWGVGVDEAESWPAVLEYKPLCIRQVRGRVYPAWSHYTHPEVELKAEWWPGFPLDAKNGIMGVEEYPRE